MIDLSGNLRKTLKKTLKRAEKLYHDGSDEEAALAFETASRLLLKLAEYAPDRAIEIKQKKDAFKYREFAKRLRAGEVPPPHENNRESDSKSAPSKKGKGNSGVKGPQTVGDSKGISSAVSQLIHTSSITWNEIGGLEEVKNEIKYALGITMASKPEGVNLQTWRNILFFGPPGTGKTLLAAATSNALHLDGEETKAVFFNVKVSSILSKYFGESTKIISELYGTARDASPAVIFLDEFESICGSRDGDDSGAERRILSTILSELDGLSEKGRTDIYVLTIAATNRPWDLDPAVLSRFDKRILIPLPDTETRRAILDIHLLRKGFEVDAEMDALVAMTEGYSGREIERFAKEVTNKMIAEMNVDIPKLVDQGLDALRAYELQIRPLNAGDFQVAASRITPQTSLKDMARYESWKDSLTES